MINFESREHMRKALYNPNSLNLIAKDAFEVADKVSNGYIDKGELEQCMKNVSESFVLLNSIKDATNEFNRLDVDKNGIFYFHKFCSLIFLKMDFKKLFGFIIKIKINIKILKLESY